MSVMQTLQMKILQQTLATWGLFLLIFLLSFSITLFLRNKAINRVTVRAAARNNNGWDSILVDVISQTRTYALFALALYLASLVLFLGANDLLLIQTVTIMIMLVQFAVWGNRLITLVVNREVKRRVGNDDQSSTMIGLIGFFARVALWTVVLMVVLDNLPNVQVTSLVASLGVTGIAVAIAVQNILRDLFASISIALDKPFVIGDFIIVDTYQGTVEAIGLKSTRIRSLFGEQIIMSNSDLLNSRIKNYKRMVDRRVSFNLKISPQTPHEKLMRVPVLVQEIVQAQSPVRFSRAHLQAIADNHLNYEVVYYVESPDYDLYMDIQQNINLALLNRLAQEEIKLAFQ